MPPRPGLPRTTPDGGLNNHTGANNFDGFFRTPTVRNVTKAPGTDGFVKAFMHNGWFKSLESVVHFYNTRDTLAQCEVVYPGQTEFAEAEALAGNCWPEAEFAATQSPSGIPGGSILVGNLGMTPAQEAALVAYIEALNDYRTAQPPLLLRLIGQY